MLYGEAFRLNKHPARTTTGVEDTAFVGFNHFHQQLHHALRGVELASAFALGGGKAPSVRIIVAFVRFILLPLGIKKKGG